MKNMKQHKEVFAQIIKGFEIDAEEHWPLFYNTWYAQDCIRNNVSHDSQEWEDDCITYCEDARAEAQFNRNSDIIVV